MNNKDVLLSSSLGVVYYAGTAVVIGFVGGVLAKAALITLASKSLMATGCLAIGAGVCINDAVKRSILASACVLTAADAQVKAKRVA